ncbi:uncharacterized protein LOC134233099 [Saccostrea cucullata]|uniref:uncharacterized protein LOC134233099 n=1 Tax=Saccostrea cuccullata TaxID=36930 RepID=UPI002ED454FD
MAYTKLHFIITLFSCSSAMYCIEKELGYKCCANYYWDLAEGNCTECMPGFFGLNCSSECTDGFYGLWCLSKCPEYCKSCNKVNGTCDEVNTINLEDLTRISSNRRMVTLPTVSKQSKRNTKTFSINGMLTSPATFKQSQRGSLLFVIISIGSTIVLVLLVVLIRNIYTISTLQPKQTILLQIQDPESEAAQNTVNPAFDPIYEN